MILSVRSVLCKGVFWLLGTCLHRTEKHVVEQWAVKGWYDPSLLSVYLVFFFILNMKDYILKILMIIFRTRNHRLWSCFLLIFVS